MIKILIVDDHEYNRELLSMMLDDFDCIMAGNGREAVALIEKDESIGLVLMDVMMPEMDGFEATKTIKENVGERFLPILFVTALDDETNLTQCLESGGDDFVPKPVSENVLLAKVSAHSRTTKLYNTLRSANEELTYHRKMMEREHNIVERIFNNASERVKTHCENLSVYTSPMSMFNGDLVLSAPSPSGGLYLLVGDFTGHGLAASIGSLPVTELFYLLASHQASVSQITREINQRLHLLLPSNMFFCAAVCEFDYRGKDFTLWLGGMNDIIWVDKNDSLSRCIESQHMPLGILSDEEFDDSPQFVSMDNIERLYIYTDGITEAQNQEEEEYGHDRLVKTIVNESVNTLEEIILGVHVHAGNTAQSDDLTIIEFKPGLLVHRDKLTNERVDVGADYHNAESIPWQLFIQLNDHELRGTSVVDQVMGFVSSIQGIELHQDKIFTIVSELYNNSLEHGVLRLDSSLKSDADGFEKYYALRQSRLAAIESQFIKIEFEYIHGEPNNLRLSIEDSGDGFEFDSLVLSESGGESHGRGMALLHHLCSSIHYDLGGRRVTAVYDLCEH